MKSIIKFIIILFLGYNSASAQKELLTYDTKGFIMDDFTVYLSSTREFITMFKKKTEDMPPRFFTYLVFKKTDTEISEIKLTGDLQFKGYACENNIFTFLYQNNLPNRQISKIYQLMDVSKDGILLKSNTLNIGDEDFILRFSYRMKLYFLTVNDREDLISLRTISDSNTIDIASIAVDKSIIRYLKEANLSFANPDIEPSKYGSGDSRIIPLGNNKFRIFTSAKIDDKKNDFIKSITLDFANHEQTLMSLKSPYKSYGCFATLKELYLINASFSQINLDIFSSEDFIKIKSHTFNKANVSSVLFESPLFNNEDSLEFKDKQSKINRIFRKFSIGSAFISALNFSDKIRITIGTSIMSGGGGSFGPVGGGSVSTPMGSVSTGGGMAFHGGYGSGDDYYLYLILDKNYESMNYSYQKSRTEILEDFISSKKQEDKKLFSNYDIVKTSTKCYLLTVSNKYKTIKLYEWGIPYPNSEQPKQ
ncbi:MAG: hypothetical protein ACOVMQ_04450 [Cyclobacteriaceae bacterium]|jgi:hypothetical protein